MFFNHDGPIHIQNLYDRTYRHREDAIWYRACNAIYKKWYERILGVWYVCKGAEVLSDYVFVLVSLANMYKGIEIIGE